MSIERRDRKIRAQLVRLMVRLGIPWARGAPIATEGGKADRDGSRGAAINVRRTPWTGDVMLVSPATGVDDLAHDIAHWVVAPPTYRRYAGFGLGASYDAAWDSTGDGPALGEPRINVDVVEYVVTSLTVLILAMYHEGAARRLLTDWGNPDGLVAMRSDYPAGYRRTVDAFKRGGCLTDLRAADANVRRGLVSRRVINEDARRAGAQLYDGQSGIWHAMEVTLLQERIVNQPRDDWRGTEFQKWRR